MSDQRPTKYRSVLFLGAPGSGKGTQTQAIGRLPGYYTFSSGAVLRGLSADSDLGHRVREYLNRGDLVPNDVMLEVWQTHMRGAINDGKFVIDRDALLLDAYPRDIEQAKALEPHLDIRAVIHLSAEDDELLKTRLRQRNARPDDRDDAVIEHRFEIYHHRTRPLIEHFGRNRVTRVDAAKDPLQVLHDVTKKLSVATID